MAAKRDVGVRVIVIMLEVGLPLPARTEIREPCASQAARVWRRAVLVQVAGDRCVCAEILRESRDLEVGVEGIGAERVIVGINPTTISPVRPAAKRLTALSAAWASLSSSTQRS